ncbi:MAG: cytochrome c3 family protein [Planctomycetota bacterium]
MKMMVGAIVVLAALAALFGGGRDGTVMAQDVPTYVGSEECARCHASHYNDFRVSGHPYKIRKAAVAKLWPTPLPKGFTWDDISYVIGGYGWKMRYIDQQGYIITDEKNGTGKTQYNMATNEWVDYHAGETKPYACGPCHMTAYSSEGNQDGLPGMVGTWEFDGIQCEECHGAGSDHVGGPSSANITIDDTALSCGKCHIRGDSALIPASGGFIKHHEQYNELLQSPHKDMKCTECHDPHKKSEFSIRKTCTDCHEGYDELGALKGIGKKHAKRGIECKDCHMPYAAKSAVAFNKFKGDIRSHLFEISTDKSHELFSEDGLTATGPLPAEWSCLGCHTDIQEKFEAKGKPEKAIQWARKGVKKIHKTPKK